MMSTTCRSALLALPLLAPVSAGLQSYDGWILVSTGHTTEIPTASNPFQGPGGLWLVHPTIPGLPVQVTGLGPDLAGMELQSGPNCVLHLPDDRVLAGEWGLGVLIDLHVLTLTGAHVSADVKIPCGTSWVGGGGINQVALLPDGSILMAVQDIVSGPLADAHLARADLEAGTVAPITVSGLPALFGMNALAVDPSGTTAYLGTNDAADQGAVYSVLVEELDGSPSAVHVADLPAMVGNLAADNDGQVLAGCFFSDVVKVDPATGTVTSLGLPPQAFNALAVARVIGLYVVAQHDDESAVPPESWIVYADAGGSMSAPLVIPPPGGWGLMTGLDVNHDPETFGPSSPGANTYEWSLAPNSGGLPIAGSLGFGLDLVSSPGSAAGLLLVSKAALASPVDFLGALLLVDPGQVVLSQAVPAVFGEQFLGLPIPPQPSLVGISLFVQAGFLEPGGVAASRGVKLTIL